MVNDQQQAGFYTLKQFKIRPILQDNTSKSVLDQNLPDSTELNKVILNWGISESINSQYVHGYAVIHEGNNVLGDLPIIGEEEVDIMYIDFYGNRRRESYYVYAVEEVQPENSINDRMVKYIIRFCSKQKLHSDTTELRRSYADQTISSMVRSIYEDYFLSGDSTDKEIEIEETSGDQTLVIPNLRPDAAINFLARRAFSSNSKSSLFRFFETREKYFFCTHEYLIEKYKNDVSNDAISVSNNLKFIYSTIDDNTGPGQMIAQQSIASLVYGNKVNTISDIKDGAYRRRVTELDYMNRTRITRDYDYSADHGQYKAVDKLKLTHTKAYINTFMQADNAPETVLIADYPQIGQGQGTDYQLKPYQYYYENYTTKPILDYHMEANSISFNIKGRGNMYPGKLINVELYNFAESLSGQRTLDKERAGVYLVLSVESSFINDEFLQKLVVSKGGLSGTAEKPASTTTVDTTFNMISGLIK